MHLIKWLLVAIGLTFGAGAWAAADSQVSQGSALSAEGASALAAGSVEVIAGSPALIVLAVNGVAAVSYTHLDVYKRQASLCAGLQVRQPALSGRGRSRPDLHPQSC